MSEKSRPRRTQAERTRQRKEQVIREAIRFFGQNGYHGTKLADIANAAGVTEPGLLHHFPSKAHLLMEVLAERDRIDRERFGPSLHDGMKAPLVLLQELVEYNETVPGLVQLFTVLVAESIDKMHPGHEFFKRRYQMMREQSIAVLKAAQARGEIRSDILAEDLVIMLFALMDGLQVQWLYESEQIKMAHLFEQFLRLLEGK
ncbi:MAG TPA: TetR/AcrR family transcriptional regulator [Aggregatilineaceae bacterium]|nr:TetR/AcrR family transcriptional regulator [Aggregatilineaceae bacterium]